MGRLGEMGSTAHGGAQVLSRPAGVTGGEPQPATGQPGVGRPRIERQGSVDESGGGLHVLAHVPVDRGHARQDLGIVGSGLQCAVGQIQTRGAVVVAIGPPAGDEGLGVAVGGQRQGRSVHAVERDGLVQQGEGGRDILAPQRLIEGQGAQVEVVARRDPGPAA